MENQKKNSVNSTLVRELQLLLEQIKSDLQDLTEFHFGCLLTETYANDDDGNHSSPSVRLTWLLLGKDHIFGKWKMTPQL